MTCRPDPARSGADDAQNYMVVMPSLEDVLAAANRGVARALAIHKALGVPTATWRDDQVVIVQPSELPALPAEHTPTDQL